MSIDKADYDSFDGYVDALEDRIKELENLPRKMLSAAGFIDGCLNIEPKKQFGWSEESTHIGWSITKDDYNQITNARTHLGGCLRKLREIVKD